MYFYLADWFEQQLLMQSFRLLVPHIISVIMQIIFEIQIYVEIKI